MLSISSITGVVARRVLFRNNLRKVVQLFIKEIIPAINNTAVKIDPALYLTTILLLITIVKSRAKCVGPFLKIYTHKAC